MMAGTKPGAAAVGDPHRPEFTRAQKLEPRQCITTFVLPRSPDF